jgi:hypothetical protein
LDTRTKIIDAATAEAAIRSLRAGGARVAAVTGYFDVLLAGKVRDLHRVSDGPKLFAFVVTPADAVLPLRARAELAAALSAVDYVIPMGDAEETDIVRLFRPAEIIDCRDAEREAMRELIRHVHRRHAG